MNMARVVSIVSVSLISFVFEAPISFVAFNRFRLHCRASLAIDIVAYIDIDRRDDYMELYDSVQLRFECEYQNGAKHGQLVVK